jgi:hypothetical protein
VIASCEVILFAMMSSKVRFRIEDIVGCTWHWALDGLHNLSFLGNACVGIRHK